MFYLHHTQYTHARMHARTHMHTSASQSRCLVQTELGRWKFVRLLAPCSRQPQAHTGEGRALQDMPLLSFSLSLTLQNTWFQIAVQETSIMTGGHGLQEHVAVRGDVLMVQRHVRLSVAVQLHG